MVIAVDHRLPAQFPQVLGEVVNEGIVIVYYQYHFQTCLPALNYASIPPSLTNLPLAFILFTMFTWKQFLANSWAFTKVLKRDNWPEF